MTEQPHETNRAYLHTIGVASLSPLVQSAITGALVGGFVLVVGLTQRWQDAGLTGLYVALGVTIILWLWHVKHWFDLTAVIQQIERATGADINGDGQIGVPAPQTKPDPQVVRVQITSAKDGHVAVKYIDLPIDNETLYQLAHGLHDGIPFSESAWTGAGKPFSQTEFRALRAELLRRGLIEQNNPAEPRQGYSLTDEGQGMIDELVKHASPHSPTAERDPYGDDFHPSARTHAPARTQNGATR